MCPRVAPGPSGRRGGEAPPLDRALLALVLFPGGSLLDAFLTARKCFALTLSNRSLSSAAAMSSVSLCQPFSRFTRSLLLAWLLAIFGLFVASDWSDSPVNSERSTVVEVSATAHKTGEGPLNTPSTCEDLEDGAEPNFALAPHWFPEPLPITNGKIVWHRPSSLRPSSVTRTPAVEPPAPSPLLG